MALETMTKLATYTVGSGGITSYTFSNIPQNYTDLRMVVSARTDRSGQPVDNIKFGINGQAANANITGIDLYSNGSGTVSNTYAQVAGGVLPGSTATTSAFGNSETYFFNYTGSTYKVITNESVSETDGTAGYVLINDALWADYNPITSITVYPDTGPNFLQHSTFTLYGVRSQRATSKATGGDTVTFDGTYWIHTFLSSGTFTTSQQLNCDYLVVAGGGPGGGSASGNAGAGGGGAGGYRTSVGSAPLVLSPNSYSVLVGAGGGGGNRVTIGTKGSDSIFATITSSGGGYGSSAGAGPASPGGSGGGGTADFVTGGAGNQPSTSPVQGYNGGTTVSGSPYCGAGGGGATAAGGVGQTSGNGAGGAGAANAISGSTVYYAGGGGGGGSNSGSGASSGGVGGGGGGSNSGVGTAGTANTGGGGGGVGGGSSPDQNGYAGGNGGSGIVIIRYKA